MQRDELLERHHIALTLGGENGGKGGDQPLRDALQALRRRWWLVVLLPLLALAAAWYMKQRQTPVYSADVLFRRDVQVSPLTQLPFQTPQSGDLIQSQIEILRSRAILQPVADSLGLRLVAEGGVEARNAAFETVSIASDFPPGEYILQFHNGQYVLRSEDGTVFARAPQGGVLAAGGLSLNLEPDYDDREPLALTLLHTEQAVDRLRQRMHVSQVGKTNLIRASYTTPDPVLTAEVLRVLGSAYQRFSAEEARQEAARRSEFLARQMSETADSLRSAQERMLVYQEQSGTLDPAVEGRALLDMSLQSEEALAELRYQENVLEQLIRQLNTEGQDDEALRRAVVLGRDVIPSAEALYTRLQELQAQRSRLTASRFGYTESGSEVQVMDSLIADTKAEMKSIVAQSLEATRDRREEARLRLEERRRAVFNLPQRSTDMARLEQEVTAIQRAYDLLADKYYEAQIAEAVEAGDVKVVDPVRVPVLPDPKHTGRALVLGGLLGLMAAIGLALLLEHLDTKVRSPADVERATKLDVLAMIPRLDSRMNGSQSERPLLMGDHLPGTEAFRTLRTMLRFSKEPQSVLSVTSAAPGEGKSVVAANLALANVNQGHGVLLIDADMRRPVQHEIFGLTGKEPGLSNLIVGDVDADGAIHRGAEGGLDVLPCGTTPPNPTALLGSETFRDLLNDMRLRYDVILIDTPPILAVADSSQIGPMVDGTLIVTRVNSTDRYALSRAVDQLRRVEAPIYGVVLNSVGAGDAGYYQYDYRSSEEPEEGLIARMRRRLFPA